MQDSQITVLPNAASGWSKSCHVDAVNSTFEWYVKIFQLMPCPDDKACTFVGTAAYVPPEVLNSSPATFGWVTFFPWLSKACIS